MIPSCLSAESVNSSKPRASGDDPVDTEKIKPFIQ